LEIVARVGKMGVTLTVGAGDLTSVIGRDILDDLDRAGCKSLRNPVVTEFSLIRKNSVP
jgi:hypothetical protein